MTMTMTDNIGARDAGDETMSDERQAQVMQGIRERVQAQKDAPCQPILWRVLVKPLPPRETSAGGIVLPDDTRAAEQMNTVVGQIVRLGGLAYKAQTKAGLELGREPNRPTIGSWVLFHQYAGQKIWAGEAEYRIVNDTDIMAVTDDPEAFRNYI